MGKEQTRCGWVHNEYDVAYHDKEWGMPQHRDGKLFEMLILEGMQAGLSWNLILKRREGMREALDGFDAVRMAAYDDAKKQDLLQNPSMIRNRLKVNALVANAKAFLAVQEEFGRFDTYIWGFVGGKPIQNRWQAAADAPATSKESDAMSKDLKKRGFKFVGSTICYAYMQAVGMVNDHEVGCPRYEACRRAGL